MATCLIGIGSNVGDRAQYLDQSVRLLEKKVFVKVMARSGWVETPPVGGPAGQGNFLNGAVLLETSLTPENLLRELHLIEDQLGRERVERWGARVIDLDLLLYDDVVLDTKSLTIPHPRMCFRQFVLEPAAAIAAEMVHPKTGWTVRQLLQHLRQSPNYIAIAGAIGSGKTRLAQSVAERTGARLIAEPLDTELLGQYYADPAGQASSAEIQFLRQRTALLKQVGEPAISDFWMNQSLAFAELFLTKDALVEFEELFRESAREIMRPRLTVLLDTSTDHLLQRIHERGRPFEDTLTVEWLNAIRQGLIRQTETSGVGPVFHLFDTTFDEAVDEVTAAFHAMQ